MIPVAVAAQAPPVLQGPPPSRPRHPAAQNWISRIEGKRGLLVLVGYAPGWAARLDDPFLQDVADELGIVSVHPKEPSLNLLGLQAPGAYLLNEFGKPLGGWTAGVPQDLRKAFEELGWKSLEAELKEFLRAHSDRLDVRWRLVQKAWNRADRRRTPANFQDLAAVLEDFLRQDGWAQLPARALPTIFPSENGRPSGPLADLAQSRLEAVKDALQRDPEAGLAWEVLDFLAPWKDDPEPRLFRVLEELEAPPQFFRSLGDWPSELAIRLAETQLRRLNDWGGLEAFAAGRRELLETRILTLAPDLPGPWSAKFLDPTFLKDAIRAIGRWQVVELEAQLEQGHFGAAETTASLILRDGDRATISAALSLARRFHAEAIVKSLED